MRSEWDALRSLAKYLAVCAGPDWEIRFDDDAVHLPYMRVEPAGPITYTGGAYITDLAQTMSVAAYAGEKPTVEAARETAAAVQHGLNDAFRWGRGHGRALRIPLYNFDGLTLRDSAPEDARIGSDFLNVTSFTSQQLPDPEDRSRIAVVANIRLSWRAMGAVPSGSVSLESVTATPSSTG